MYNVNASVPKTLVRRLVGWVAAHGASDARARGAAGGARHAGLARAACRRARTARSAQRTEDLIGPYELHDFFLYCLLRLRRGSRARSCYLASHAFAGRYDEATLRRWLRVFLERFFAQQFKRSVMPDGPEGRLGEPVAARRLAHAERRRAPRPGCASWTKQGRVDPGRRRLRRRPLAGAAGHPALPQQRRAPARRPPRRGAAARARPAGRTSSWSTPRCPARPALVAGAAAGPAHALDGDRRARALRVRLRPPRPARGRRQRDPAAAARRRLGRPADAARARAGAQGHAAAGRPRDRGRHARRPAVPGRALNLSVNGVLLECRQPLEVGDDLRLAFELPAPQGRVRGTGTVVRQRPPQPVRRRDHLGRGRRPRRASSATSSPASRTDRARGV